MITCLLHSNFKQQKVSRNKKTETYINERNYKKLVCFVGKKFESFKQISHTTSAAYSTVFCSVLVTLEIVIRVNIEKFLN